MCIYLKCRGVTCPPERVAINKSDQRREHCCCGNWKLPMLADRRPCAFCETFGKIQYLLIPTLTFLTDIAHFPSSEVRNLDEILNSDHERTRFKFCTEMYRRQSKCANNYLNDTQAGSILERVSTYLFFNAVYA